MEHWFDRATKIFAGGAISRRGLLERRPSLIRMSSTSNGD
jgi:hypothetical protein